MSLNEPPEILFKKKTGKETSLQILSETKITHGTWGEVFDTMVLIGGHKKKFIVKKYIDKGYDDKDSDSQKLKTKRAFENYYLAKDANLKVFPTFRIGEDEKSILMTTGFSDDVVCIGANSLVDVTSFERERIKEIKNIDTFLKNIFDEAIKASKAGIFMSFDVFFFLVTRKEPAEIDFVLGDFDNLKKKDVPIYPPTNISSVKTALEDFCDKNLDSKYKEYFLEKINEYFLNFWNQFK